MEKACWTGSTRFTRSVAADDCVLPVSSGNWQRNPVNPVNPVYNPKRKLWSLLEAFLLAALLVALIVYGSKTQLRQYLMNRLTHTSTIPPGTNCDAAYILGGSPPSLLLKFKKVALLYRHGKCKRILVPHRPGITEYSPQLGRNLANDEWSIIELGRLGISSCSIQLINIKKGFFGTFSEAKTVSALVEKRGYRSLLLVTAPHHTRRTLASFKYFLHEYPAKLYIEASSEKAGLHELLLEFLKLQIYHFFLLSDKKEAKGMSQTGSTELKAYSFRFSSRKAKCWRPAEGRLPFHSFFREL